MKPIEIHIEGYKIVISEDDGKPKVTEEKVKEDDTLVYKPKPNTLPYTIPCPYTPPTIAPYNDEWWKYPYVTWTGGEVSTTNTTKPDFHPVYDTMIGKTAMADGGIVNIKLTPEQIANAPKNDPVGEKGVPDC